MLTQPRSSNSSRSISRRSPPEITMDFPIWTSVPRTLHLVTITLITGLIETPSIWPQGSRIDKETTEISSAATTSSRGMRGGRRARNKLVKLWYTEMFVITQSSNHIRAGAQYKTHSAFVNSNLSGPGVAGCDFSAFGLVKKGKSPSSLRAWE